MIDLDQPVFLLVFLALFHLLGGGALGVALRNIVRDRQGCRDQAFLLIWGATFGGLPLLAGVSSIWLLTLQVAELTAGVLLTFFFWDQIRDLFGKPEIAMITVGGVFFAVGCTAFGLLLGERQVVSALALGGSFGGLGGPVCYLGLRRLFRKPGDPGDDS